MLCDIFYTILALLLAPILFFWSRCLATIFSDDN